ncbi:ClbS/DfsB family four-helix bundle protein [Maribacter sp. 2308TA10-17]|uniref:ClbS/DfsB family four-helix bundle protein n=1 Tax=Maribacter sp. 2308TA10-17 TaxID=3386276 RepID=UPI0039BCD170
MSRPKTKEELLFLSQNNYTKLNNYIDLLPKNVLQNEFPKGYLNRNIRDVIAHLHHWHLMLLEWHKVGLTGVKPDMPAKGYTWKTMPELNLKIREKYENTDLSEARKILDESYTTVQKLIKNHSEAALFEKKKYHWTGSTSLAAYIISATSSHYDWALKLIKKCRKSS